MSSPQIIRMLGFFCSADAEKGNKTANAKPTATNAKSLFMWFLCLNCGRAGCSSAAVVLAVDQMFARCVFHAAKSEMICTGVRLALCRVAPPIASEGASRRAPLQCPRASHDFLRQTQERSREK